MTESIQENDNIQIVEKIVYVIKYSSNTDAQKRAMKKYLDKKEERELIEGKPPVIKKALTPEQKEKARIRQYNHYLRNKDTEKYKEYAKLKYNKLKLKNAYYKKQYKELLSKPNI